MLQTEMDDPNETNTRSNTLTALLPGQKAFIRNGFRWDAADAYLFDIDGTLLNCRDAVHYGAFSYAVQDVLGIQAGIDGVPVHGNTDIGILRAALQRAGVDEAQLNLHLPM